MDDQALYDQATAAGREAAARFDLPAPLEEWRSLIALIASVGWIEGRQAGGEEAKGVMRRAFDKLRNG